MDHEPSPMSNTKMPKAKPIAHGHLPHKQHFMRVTNNELEHTYYWPPQGILHPCTSGKERCVDLEIWF
jgi:hypothetical protein